jgi:isocitrate lyase
MTPAKNTAKTHESPQDRVAREAKVLERRWSADERWKGIRRDYSAANLLRLRGTVRQEYSLARLGAERLWSQLMREDGEAVRTFGALTGAQAVQMVRAGLEAIYLSGWQVAADGNLAGQTYPDQSLYPWIRSSGARAETEKTGWCRSWRTRKPVSADRCTRSSSPRP